MQNHIDRLIESLGIAVEFSTDSLDCWYDPKTRTITIPEKIQNAQAYFTALHELGHVHLNHETPSDWNGESHMEYEAWVWAFGNSEETVTPDILNFANSCLLKCSCHKDRKLTR